MLTKLSITKTILLILAGAALIGLSACATVSPNGATARNDDGSYVNPVFVSKFPDITTADVTGFVNEDVFKVGDTADVIVYNTEDLSGSYIVDRKGQIGFPLIGSVEVAGLSTLELQDRLVQLYGQRYLQDPSIAVKLEARKLGKIVVDGAVVKPGVFEMFSLMRLSEAVALGGGLNENANRKEVYVVRDFNGERKVLVANLNDIRKLGAEDPHLIPNDIVFVQDSAARIAFKEILATVPLVNTLAILSTR